MLTYDALIDDLNRRLKLDIFHGKAVYLKEKPLKKGTILHIGGRTYPIYEDAFLVIIDEAPGAFWEHPVLYELHNVNPKSEADKMIPIYAKRMPGNKDIRESLILFYPHSIKEAKLVEAAKMKKMKEEEIKDSVSQSVYFLPPDTSKKHAILFGGPDGNFQYDIANMRDVLWDRFVFTSDNTHILLGDGSHQYLPTNQTITGCQPAAKKNLDELLLAYARGGKWELGGEDTLFIYILTHGGSSSGMFFFLTFGMDDSGKEQNNYYYDFELAERLSFIACGQMIVVINTCESGGFIKPIIDKVSRSAFGPKKIVVMSGCGEEQLGWTLIKNQPHFFELKHGAFSVFFYSALNGGFLSSLSGDLPEYAKDFPFCSDTDGDGLVSIMDAFKWSDHIMRDQCITSLFGIELPRYADYPENVGARIFLGKPELQVREICPRLRELNIFFMDPAVIPTDDSVCPAEKYNWGNIYRAGQTNRIVALVINSGSAPCRDITVEFHLEHEGVMFYLGDFRITEINTGKHDYAYIDWKAPSSLSVSKISSVIVRATCPADPAPPFTENGGNKERHQAQLSYLSFIEENKHAPFKKIRSFGPIYEVIKNLLRNDINVAQEESYSKIFHLNYESNKFTGLELGALYGTVSIVSKKGNRDEEKVEGSVTAELMDDSSFEKQSVNIDPHSRYAFILLPVGKYSICVNTMHGSMDDIVNITKGNISKKNFVLIKHEMNKKLHEN